MKIVYQNSKEKKAIKKAMQGNRIAQKWIFDQYAPKMLSVCRSYVSPLEKAEELLLDGFFKAFTKIRQYKERGSFEGWLRRIIVHEALSYLRKQPDFLVLDETLEGSALDMPSEFHNSFSAEDIQRHIDKLPVLYRTVFVMFGVEGYSHAEISKTLKIPINTSKSYLLRARKKLQEGLTQKTYSKNGTGSIR